MVSAAAGSTHCSGVTEVSDVTLSSDDVVDQVPMPGARVHPGMFMYSFVIEERASDGNTLDTISILPDISKYGL